MSLSDNELRGGAAIQQLHWLAAGQVDSAGLLRAYEAAIARDNGRLNAFLALADDAAQQAAASDARRRANTIGRLDGLVVAVKDNLDVAGLPTT
ncbi:MAG: amidase, partial [Dokdonella sp.]